MKAGKGTGDRPVDRWGAEQGNLDSPLERLGQEQIPVFALGMGTPEGGFVPADPASSRDSASQWHRDDIGRPVESRLDEKTLRPHHRDLGRRVRSLERQGRTQGDGCRHQESRGASLGYPARAATRRAVPVAARDRGAAAGARVAAGPRSHAHRGAPTGGGAPAGRDRMQRRERGIPACGAATTTRTGTPSPTRSFRDRSTSPESHGAARRRQRRLSGEPVRGGNSALPRGR